MTNTTIPTLENWPEWLRKPPLRRKDPEAVKAEKPKAAKPSPKKPVPNPLPPADTLWDFPEEI